ncbi:unnamed protein product [Rhizoctonia solani]|uniref:PITH domain-containing protein n=1 Tax=Rhizoctonia solani TaxID=456999 RepID=A0A8H3DY29_9AGAM|nr:unnamed protein product [Rhizoctonia solani]
MSNGTNGTNEMVAAFFYGTLMHPAVLKRVIGNDASHLQAAPAVLMASLLRQEHHVRNCDYPAIVPYNVGTVLLKRELNRDERCVRGVIISGLRREDVACLDIFEGDEYNRIQAEAHPIVPLAPISSSLTQALLSASSELPTELPSTLKVEAYIWAAATSRLEPIIWEYDTFVKDKLWKWAGSGAGGNEYYEEVDRRRDMNGVIVVPSGEGTLKPDYTFGHNMLNHFMFDEGYINLNHGSYGSIPRMVFDKCVELGTRIEGRPDSFHRREYQSQLLDVRTRLAKLLNCNVDECVISNNTTHGLHTIINNFNWKEGDILVSFSVTYGAVSKICHYISDKPPNPQHISIQLTFPVSHKVIIEEFRQKLRDIPRKDGQTIVAVIDALASNPGVQLPWEEMTKICKEEGIYSLIDGAHAIGQIPLDLSHSNPDFFVSNCHKWLYAKRGAAVVYVAKRNQGIMRSSFPTSHAYVSLKSGGESDMAAQFEWTGTIDFVPFLSIKYALDFREAIGGEKHINDYCHSLAVSGGEKLAEILKTKVMETEGRELTVNMVNVQLPLDAPAGIPVNELARIFHLINDRLLDEHNIYAPIYIHGNQWWTRCSAQIWNEESDFIHLGRAFVEICKEVQTILKGLPRSDTSIIGDHDHDHEHDSGSPNNLYGRIDRPNVVALNAEEGSDPCAVLKPWHERLDETRWVESDADDQLILRIPFTGSVKLRGLLLKTGPGDQTAQKASLFPNADELDFSDANDREPAQSFDVVQSREIGEYTVKPAKFSSCRSLTLFFPSAQGADTLKIYYVGLVGEWSQFTQDPVVTVYEAQANPADHKKIFGTDGALSRPGV